MSVVDFSWSSALIGGSLIGLAAVVMMFTIGQISGVSGIVSSVLRPGSSLPWQWAFLVGLFVSGVLVHWFHRPISLVIETPLPFLLVAGLLVGFGTRLGSGCTSGHGVCGIARFSPRSLVATMVFVTVGILTVIVGTFA